jgi:hypothetical protein
MARPKLPFHLSAAQRAELNRLVHLGWRLGIQTSALNAGLRTNWVPVAGSSLTNQMSFSINPTNGSVFFRLIHP